jgi:hypothetical protein
VQRINALFKAHGVTHGVAALDARGRIELKGQFADDGQVDIAFSLAQTVVGVRWVSPVTPEHIKVKAWEDCLSRLMSGERCAAPAPPAGAPGPSATAPGPIGEKYAVVVGVGRFRSEITPLQYANKDAWDVYTYLVDPAGGNFKRGNVVLLRDEHATRERVVRALGEIQRVARPDDLVLVYLSSHGTPPDKFGGVHVVTHDSQVRPRERVWDTSLNEQLLREFIERVPSQRLVIVMDACYSNGAYRQVAGFLPPGGKSLETDAAEGAGRSRAYMARLIGAKDLVAEDARWRAEGARGRAEDAAPRPGAAPADGWGKVLISASDAGERSWESDELRNSVFTRYWLEGLRRHRGSMKEAFEHARPLVRQQVRREKGPDVDQNPQLMPSRRDWNMSIAVAGR